MKSRFNLYCFICFFIFITRVNSTSPSFDIQGDVSDPKTNLYSIEIENSLLERNYIKVLYEDFSSTSLFKKAHMDIYKEEYKDVLPNKIDYYKMDDSLYYCMLSNNNYDEDPPILTFLILEKDDIKYVFYKINYMKTYEIVEKEYYDPQQNWELKTRLVKVFY